MDYSRIEHVIDVLMMQCLRATIVGCGGSFDLCSNLVRNGLGRIRLVDFDRVEAANVARQSHMTDTIQEFKVDALARHLSRINLDIGVECWPKDFTQFTDDEIDQHFGDTDVFVFATDNFMCQARGNEVALRLNKPAVWIGVYPGGKAGEIVFWHPGLSSCYRCLCSARYEAFAKGFVNPSSNGATIMDVHLVDAIAGMITIGLLTRGANNRYGKLIDQLGDRNFIQVKIDPEWKFAGRDVVKDQLGISDSNDTYFTWNAIARRNPDPGGCPDCKNFNPNQRREVL